MFDGDGFLLRNLTSFDIADEVQDRKSYPSDSNEIFDYVEIVSPLVLEFSLFEHNFPLLYFVHGNKQSDNSFIALIKYF